VVTDYEAAWSRLQQRLAAKTQWGRDELLLEMARLQGDCRVPAGELSRLLRLYGVEVERVRSMSIDQATSEDFDGGLVSSADPERAGRDALRGDFDGSRRGTEAVGSRS
jgi:hypothetical protein